MPGQNNVCYGLKIQAWSSGESRSHCPVPGWRRLFRSLLDESTWKDDLYNHPNWRTPFALWT